MHKELLKYKNRLKTTFRDNAADVLYWIIGRNIDFMDRDTMLNIWIICGHIEQMYQKGCHKMISIVELCSLFDLR